MNLLDRFRIASAVWRYGTWLALHDVSGPHRRELTRELRASLGEAAAAKGATAAVRELGGLHRLAAEAAVTRPRSRWSAGGAVAIAAGLLLVVAQLIAQVNFVAGAQAADPAAPVRGELFPFLGSEVVYTPGIGGALTVEHSFGWLFSAILVGVAVVVARPRLLSLRRASAAA